MLALICSVERQGKVPPTPLCRPRFPCSETRNREKRLDFQRETALHIPEHAILDLGEVSSVQNFSGPLEVVTYISVLF